MKHLREKSAFPKLADIFAATSVGMWRDYLSVRYLHAINWSSPGCIATDR
jgi:hypothetical protein